MRVKFNSDATIWAEVSSEHLLFSHHTSNASPEEERATVEDCVKVCKASNAPLLHTISLLLPSKAMDGKTVCAPFQRFQGWMAIGQPTIGLCWARRSLSLPGWRQRLLLHGTACSDMLTSSDLKCRMLQPAQMPICLLGLHVQSCARTIHVPSPAPTWPSGCSALQKTVNMMIQLQVRQRQDGHQLHSRAPALQASTSALKC